MLGTWELGKTPLGGAVEEVEEEYCIKIEKFSEGGQLVATTQFEITQRGEIRSVFEPYLSDASAQKDADTFDPRFQHDFLKGRRKFLLHERVTESESKTAEQNAHDKINFFVFKEFKDRFKLWWRDYWWWVVPLSARIVKTPAMTVYDFYLELVGMEQ